MRALPFGFNFGRWRGIEGCVHLSCGAFLVWERPLHSLSGKYRESLVKPSRSECLHRLQ